MKNPIKEETEIEISDKKYKDKENELINIQKNLTQLQKEKNEYDEKEKEYQNSLNNYIYLLYY